MHRLLVRLRCEVVLLRVLVLLQRGMESEMVEADRSGDHMRVVVVVVVGTYERRRDSESIADAAETLAESE